MQEAAHRHPPEYLSQYALLALTRLCRCDHLYAEAPKQSTPALHVSMQIHVVDLKRHGPFVVFYFYCKIMLYGIHYTYKLLLVDDIVCFAVCSLNVLK